MHIVLKFVVTSLGLAPIGLALAAPLAGLQPENSFISFSTERTKVSAYLACAKPRLLRASGELGALYSCVGGKNETVKFFVNELPNSGGRVKNVKFLWNDYTKNIGEGVHADAAVAKQWVGELASMYAPKHGSQVQNVFFGNKNAVIESATHILVYTYRKGPAADERMFVVTKK